MNKSCSQIEIRTLFITENRRQSDLREERKACGFPSPHFPALMKDCRACGWCFSLTLISDREYKFSPLIFFQFRESSAVWMTDSCLFWIKKDHASICLYYVPLIIFPLLDYFLLPELRTLLQQTNVCLWVYFGFYQVIFLLRLRPPSLVGHWAWTMEIDGEDYCRTKTLRHSHVKMFVSLEHILNPSVFPYPY